MIAISRTPTIPERPPCTIHEWAGFKDESGHTFHATYPWHCKTRFLLVNVVLAHIVNKLAGLPIIKLIVVVLYNTLFTNPIPAAFILSSVNAHNSGG
jgi:hypothetical protein